MTQHVEYLADHFQAFLIPHEYRSRGAHIKTAEEAAVDLRGWNRRQIQCSKPQPMRKWIGPWPDERKRYRRCEP